jgi:hypothetical protein
VGVFTAGRSGSTLRSKTFDKANSNLKKQPSVPISRNTLLEHGAPLMARCLTDKIIELGVLPAGSGIAPVCSILRNYPEEFVRLPERRFWIAGEPLGT